MEDTPNTSVNVQIDQVSTSSYETIEDPEEEFNRFPNFLFDITPNDGELHKLTKFQLRVRRIERGALKGKESAESGHSAAQLAQQLVQESTERVTLLAKDKTKLASERFQVLEDISKKLVKVELEESAEEELVELVVEEPNSADDLQLSPTPSVSEKTDIIYEEVSSEESVGFERTSSPFAIPVGVLTVHNKSSKEAKKLARERANNALQTTLKGAQQTVELTTKDADQVETQAKECAEYAKQSMLEEIDQINQASQPSNQSLQKRHKRTKEKHIDCALRIAGYLKSATAI